MLHGESYMGQEYGVSLNSVRGALGILRAEGLLVTVRGKGTRVRRQEDVAVVKIPPGATITARPCTEVEARELSVPEGTWVFVVEHAGRVELYRTDETQLHTTAEDSEE
jgi:GntR family transcriptional regulator